MPTKTHHPGPSMQSRYCGLGSNCGSNQNALGHSASNDASSRHRSGFGWQAGYFYSVVSCLRWKLLHVMCKLSCCTGGFWWRPAYWVLLFSTQVFVLCFLEVSCLSVNMYTSVSFVTQDNECFDADRWRHHPTDNSRSVWTRITNGRLPRLRFLLWPTTSPRGNTRKTRGRTMRSTLFLLHLFSHFFRGVAALSVAPLTRSGCGVGLVHLALCVFGTELLKIVVRETIETNMCAWKTVGGVRNYHVNNLTQAVGKLLKTRGGSNHGKIILESLALTAPLHLSSVCTSRNKYVKNTRTDRWEVSGSQGSAQECFAVSDSASLCHFGLWFTAEEKMRQNISL